MLEVGFYFEVGLYHRSPVLWALGYLCTINLIRISFIK
jgi:hypothetical protein